MANVTIYTTPTCSFCKMAKAYFQENDVKFEEKDVTIDFQAQQDMLQSSGQLGVPVIDIDGTIVVGFDKPKVAAALGLKA